MEECFWQKRFTFNCRTSVSCEQSHNAEEHRMRQRISEYVRIEYHVLIPVSRLWRELHSAEFNRKLWHHSKSATDFAREVSLTFRSALTGVISQERVSWSNLNPLHHILFEKCQTACLCHSHESFGPAFRARGLGTSRTSALEFRRTLVHAIEITQ